jgi:hypothetical protein
VHSQQPTFSCHSGSTDGDHKYSKKHLEQEWKVASRKVQYCTTPLGGFHQFHYNIVELISNLTKPFKTNNEHQSYLLVYKVRANSAQPLAHYLAFWSSAEAGEWSKTSILEGTMNLRWVSGARPVMVCVPCHPISISQKRVKLRVLRNPPLHHRSVFYINWHRGLGS